MCSSVVKLCLNWESEDGTVGINTVANDYLIQYFIFG